jgi:uncharacterized membrane protein
MNKPIMYLGVIMMIVGFLAVFYGIYQLNIMPINNYTATYNTTNTSWMFTPSNPQGLSILGSFPAFVGTFVAIEGIYMSPFNQKTVVKK